jgi:hypothetical protein
MPHLQVLATLLQLFHAFLYLNVLYFGLFLTQYFDGDGLLPTLDDMYLQLMPLIFAQLIDNNIRNQVSQLVKSDDCVYIS